MDQQLQEPTHQTTNKVHSRSIAADDGDSVSNTTSIGDTITDATGPQHSKLERAPATGITSSKWSE
eukprot:1565644-Amphidinium_carterae.1